jgi:hypothetical protein
MGEGDGRRAIVDGVDEPFGGDGQIVLGRDDVDREAGRLLGREQVHRRRKIHGRADDAIARSRRPE